MENAVAVIGIAGALAIGAMSPGPSFVMVARAAVASSRGAGLAAALGMGVGGVLFAFAALFGLQVLLSAVPWLYVVLKAMGGLYLIYLGCRIWRGARESLAVQAESSGETGKLARSFTLGLITQISNPKTAVVYASVFAAMLPGEVPLSLFVVLPALIFVIETGWYAIVAYVLSSESPRAVYLRFKAGIDRTAGGVMILLGVRLAATAR